LKRLRMSAIAGGLLLAASLIAQSNNPPVRAAFVRPHAKGDADDD